MKKHKTSEGNNTLTIVCKYSTTQTVYPFHTQFNTFLDTNSHEKKTRKRLKNKHHGS